MVKDREAWCAAVRGATESEMTEQLNNHSDVKTILRKRPDAEPGSEAKPGLLASEARSTSSVRYKPSPSRHPLGPSPGEAGLYLITGECG